MFSIYFNHTENKLAVSREKVEKVTVTGNRKTTSLLRPRALKIVERSLVSAIPGCSLNILELKLRFSLEQEKITKHQK